jgi:hypothetical protein
MCIRFPVSETKMVRINFIVSPQRHFLLVEALATSATFSARNSSMSAWIADQPSRQLNASVNSARRIEGQRASRGRPARRSSRPPKPIEANKNQSVDGAEGLFLRSGSPQNVYLLRQHPNFHLERCPRPKQICDHPNNEPDKISHPARASPDSRSTASQIEFATWTASHSREIITRNENRESAHRRNWRPQNQMLANADYSKRNGDSASSHATKSSCESVSSDNKPRPYLRKPVKV